MKKRKLLLAAIAASMLIPTAFVPVAAATDNGTTGEPANPPKPVTDVPVAVAANLTKGPGQTDSDPTAPSYGQADNYSVKIEAPGAEETGIEKVITVTATGLKKTINSKNNPNFWVGIGILEEQDESEYKYAWDFGSVPSSDFEANANQPGEGRLQDKDGKKYRTLYWSPDLSKGEEWETTPTLTTGYIIVQKTTTGNDADPVYTKYKVNFNVTTAKESTFLEAEKIATDAQLPGEKSPIELGEVTSIDLSTKAGEENIFIVAGEANAITGWTAASGNANTAEHYVAVKLSTPIKNAVIKAGTAGDKTATITNEGIAIIKIEDFKSDGNYTPVPFELWTPAPESGGTASAKFAEFKLDLKGVNFSNKSVTNVALPQKPDIQENSSTIQEDVATEAEQTAIDTHSQDAFTNHVNDLLKDKMSEIKGKASNKTNILIEPGIVVTAASSTKDTNNKVKSYTIEVKPRVKVYASDNTTPQSGDEVIYEATENELTDLGVFGNNQITLEFFVPQDLHGQTLYVHHYADGHDTTGSTQIVTAGQDGKVSVPVNHFSKFTLSLAEKAEVKGYKLSTDTKGKTVDEGGTISAPVGSTINFAKPSDITLVVTSPSNSTVNPDGDGNYVLDKIGEYTVKATDQRGGGASLPEGIYKINVTRSSGDSPAPGGTVKPAVKTQIMYRVYNQNNGEHFFTANKAEKDYLVSLGWKDEGTAWNAPATSDTPVFRVYNKNSGEHFYTTNAEEKAHLVSVGWQDEGIGWYSDEKKGVAVHRLFNPNAKDAGSHHYTVSESERDYLAGIGWRKENVGWYGVK